MYQERLMLEISEEEIITKMNDRTDCDIEYLIENVIPSKGRYAIIGLAGSGKTTLVLDQMVHVSLGTDWMGCKTNQGKILWLNGESIL
jgi:RecA-family ATPase